MPHDIRRTATTSLALAVLFLALATPALASSGGGGLPWEQPLQQIQESITGPVAGFIALAAVAIAAPAANEPTAAMIGMIGIAYFARGAFGFGAVAVFFSRTGEAPTRYSSTLRFFWLKNPGWILTPTM